MMNKPVFEGEILLCEDNIINRELICERLAKLGLKTVTAENGKEGVEKVEYRIQNGIKPFDLIFMDIFMPVMDGMEAAAQIGKLNTGTPIIALTANDDPADREQYAAHGMPDYLSKPFTSQELINCLSKHLPPVNMNSDHHLNAQDEEELKNKLIHVFVKKYKNFYNEISRAIDDGDIKLAHRLAHTLKGGAGMLGKTRLQNAAKDVEEPLKNEENKVTQSAMDALKAELDAVLEEFAPLAAEGIKHENPSTEVKKEEIQALLKELGTLLDGGDVKCLNLIYQLRSIQNINEPLVRELIQQMEFFEFDMAKKTLAQLKKTEE